MKTSELNNAKLELIQWISNLQDDKFIQLMNSFRISKSDSDFWNELSDQQKDEIDLGIAQLDNGEGIAIKDFLK
ncbi:hypothetical protein [Crocinitomix catalasitica]|uniref:hypothetical protein n=1 Tax=Crocinitomix catalasitica TaxID=184607 RepID=UPI00055CB9BD|nr:hypothetical protein [Crocinitomix catalasitica]